MTGERLISAGLKLAAVAACVWLIATALSVAPDSRGLGTHERLGLEPCGYLAQTGRPCITCGMTTSFAHTVRFQLLDALAASPAGTLLCLLVMAAPAFLLHSLLTGTPARRAWLWRGSWLLLPGAVLVLLASWAFKIWTWGGAS